MFGTRFYTFSLLGDRFSFEMGRFSLRSNVTLSIRLKISIDWFRFHEVFFKFTFVFNFHSFWITSFFFQINRLSILYKKRAIFLWILFHWFYLWSWKVNNIQNLLLSNYQNDNGTTKIFRDHNGSVTLRTAERWCKTVRDTDSINLSSPPDRVREPFEQRGNSQKINTSNRVTKVPLITNNRSSLGGISSLSIRRILKKWST